MIHASGCFNYQIPLRRRHDGAWEGQASPGDADLYHPGLVGECPHLVLLDGCVTLTCTESASQQQLRPVYRKWPVRTHQVVFDVGPAIEQVAEDGALLRVTRSGTGDLGAEFLRDQQLVLAIGNVDTSLRGVIGVEYDPRVDDDDLYWVKYVLSKPDTQLVWIDAEQCDLEATRQSFGLSDSGWVQLACRSRSREESLRLNHALLPDRTLARRSHGWADVDPRFKTPDEWVAYIRSLPDERPDDVYVRFDVAGTGVTLREREYAFLEPWHIYLHRIRRRGVPGKTSHMGIARDHSGVDKATVIESTNRIATRSIRIG